MKALASNFYPYSFFTDAQLNLPGYDEGLKYCRHASPDFNGRMDLSLHSLADEVRQAMEENLAALLLGGSYGRGEGGVVVVEGFERPYNDLNLVPIVNDKACVHHEALASISRRHESDIGIRVDFSDPLTIEDVQNWPRLLKWQDLLGGHITLFGPEEILTSNAPPSLYDPLPAIEATRLLLNAGAGLIRAMRAIKGAEPAPDADFVRRSYFKCGLALGDAVLIAHRRYSTPYRGRDEKLTELVGERADVSALNVELLYELSLLFKLRPDGVPEVPLSHSSLAILARLWGATFLHVERLRTGRDFASLDEYSRWLGLREPELHAMGAIPRNVICNIQVGKLSWLSPREWLYRKLPVLLGLTTREVGDWAGESERFLVVWRRFN